jgi:hypothetical protein
MLRIINCSIEPVQILIANSNDQVVIDDERTISLKDQVSSFELLPSFEQLFNANEQVYVTIISKNNVLKHNLLLKPRYVLTIKDKHINEPLLKNVIINKI